jgi:hypothetical protein
MVAEARALQLAGSEVYRFGGHDPTWLTIKEFRLAHLSDLRVPGSRRANLRTKPGP